MKTKTHHIPVRIALFTLVFAAAVFSIAAVPAMAGPAHVSDSAVLDLMHIGDLDRLHEILDSRILAEVLPGIADDLLPEGPFPDGGGWEPVFPDDAADDGGDEAVEEPAEEAAGDEAVEEPAEEAGDEAVEEPAEDAGDEAVDEPAEEAIEEEPLADEPEAGDEVDELPFTGGDSTPWLIAGAGVILAGIILAFGLGRRNRNAAR